MATYQFAVTSAERDFKVKDIEEVTSVFQSLGYEETYSDKENNLFIGGYEKTIDDDLVIIEKATNKAVGVITNCGDEYFSIEDSEELDYEEYNNEEKYSHVKWQDYLQEKLLDSEQVAVITESGYEKLRYSGSYTIIISKQGIFENSSFRFIQDTLTKLNIKK